MRIVVTAFVLIVSLAHGSEAINFPFVGTVKVRSATKYWDGGSVTVVLCDEKAEYSVHYRTREAGEANRGSLLTFASKEDDAGIVLTRGSMDENRLLNYLRSASVVSYGTANPDVLLESFLKEGTENPYDRMAMASLLRHFEEKNEPNKPEMATPRKPSD